MDGWMDGWIEHIPTEVCKSTNMDLNADFWLKLGGFDIWMFNDFSVPLICPMKYYMILYSLYADNKMPLRS